MSDTHTAHAEALRELADLIEDGHLAPAYMTVFITASYGLDVDTKVDQIRRAVAALGTVDVEIESFSNDLQLKTQIGQAGVRLRFEGDGLVEPVKPATPHLRDDLAALLAPAAKPAA